MSNRWSDRHAKEEPVCECVDAGRASDSGAAGAELYATGPGRCVALSLTTSDVAPWLTWPLGTCTGPRSSGAASRPPALKLTAGWSIKSWLRSRPIRPSSLLDYRQRLVAPRRGLGRSTGVLVSQRRPGSYAGSRQLAEPDRDILFRGPAQAAHAERIRDVDRARGATTPIRSPRRPDGQAVRMELHASAAPGRLRQLINFLNSAPPPSDSAAADAEGEAPVGEASGIPI